MAKGQWREDRVVLQSKEVYKYIFHDTRPNHMVFSNNSNSNLYVCSSSLVSDRTFDMIVPPYGTKLYARQDGVGQIFMYQESAQPITVMITSFVDTFNPASITQTQEIVATSGSGLLGVVTVDKIYGELPSGTKNIGRVDIENITKSLPPGSNKIGSVDVEDFKKPLPPGENVIGKVEVTNFPVQSNFDGKVLIKPMRARQATIEENVMPSRRFDLDRWYGFKKGSIIYSMSCTDPEARISLVSYSDADWIPEDQRERILYPEFTGRIQFNVPLLADPGTCIKADRDCTVFIQVEEMKW